MYTSISLLAALAVTAAAKTVVITAGSGGFVFSPDSVTADVGDVLEFHFVGSIHSAVQGDFSTPCSQGSLSSKGFDSGPVTSSDVFQVTVQNTDPIWFFCATPTHCQGGMVGVVNPPSSGDSLATYKSNAADTSSSSSAGKAQGGVVVAAGSSGSSSGSSSSPGSSTSPTVPSSSTSPTTSSSAVISSSSGSTSASETASVQSSSRSTTTSTQASGSTTSSPTSSPSAASTGGSNSLMEMSGKVVILGLVISLGTFVVFMA